MQKLDSAVFFLLAFSILLTLITGIYTQYLLNAFETKRITAKVPSVSGNVTVTLSSQMSILLYNTILNFGTGYVNRSKCPTNATLNAGATYNDTEGQDCWTDNSINPTSFILENNGNRNVLVTVRGPTEYSFFRGYNGPDPYNLTWKAREIYTGSCSSGLSTQYQSFAGQNKLVCSEFRFIPGSNRIGIDIRLVIPARNLTAGTYSNSSIEFTAVQS